MQGVIRRIELYKVQLPFRRRFGHALHVRTSSDSIIVRVLCNSGHQGYGESLPREYVTGETQESVVRDLSGPAIKGLIGRPLGSFDDAVRMLREHEQLKGAARCAIELALLDAAGKISGRPVADLLGGLRERSLSYSGVIGASSTAKTALTALYFRFYGVQQLKLKVGDESDTERLRVARYAAGRACDIRLDANCAWTPEQAIERLTLMRDYRFSVIEQPVARHDIEGMARVSAALPEPVMADESLCTFNDARMLASKKACDMFNIRISKCGGLLESDAIAHFADRYGLSWQLGCQVGESGILSAAGRILACCHPGHRYCEGSYGPYLLREDITAETFSFGYGGRAKALTGSGLGVTVKQDVLSRYAEQTICLT